MATGEGCHDLRDHCKRKNNPLYLFWEKGRQLLHIVLLWSPPSIFLLCYARTGDVRMYICKYIKFLL